MLNEKDSSAWKAKVKAIFEAKKALKEAELEAPKMDLGADSAEDPETAPPVDVDTEAPPEGLSGEEGEQEESPSITITADCLLALFEYFQADENGDEDGSDDLDIDAEEPVAPEAESQVGSLPTGLAGGMGTGMIGMESEEKDIMPEPVAATQPGEGTGEGGDDIAASDDTLTDTNPEGSEELTPEVVVQKLLDISADHEGPLDVDVLGDVFSSPEEGSDLGGDDLATNTELPGDEGGEEPLPATTGKSSVGPLAEDTANVGSASELDRKHKALSALEARLKSASDESDKSDIRDDIAAVKSQIAKIKTKHITSAQGHKHGEAAKAGHKDDADA